MKLIRLIAESGGTKTDWCGIDEQKNRHRFTTESYHPHLVNEEFIVRQKVFWDQYEISTCVLHFYGSGCLQKDQQEKMKVVLKEIGFPDPYVDSDLFAAAKAVNNETGMTAICGTGSVLFKVEYEQLIELRGGFGWDKGDEGSGFYFGKLLLWRLKSVPGDYPEIRKQIESYKSIDELFLMKDKPESKSEYSRLALLFSDHSMHPLISAVHMENIQLFLKKYAKECRSVGFAGSYAFGLQDYFKLACKQRNIEVSGFIQHPIDVLEKDLFL